MENHFTVTQHLEYFQHFSSHKYTSDEMDSLKTFVNQSGKIFKEFTQRGIFPAPQCVESFDKSISFLGDLFWTIHNESMIVVNKYRQRFMRYHNRVLISNVENDFQITFSIFNDETLDKYPVIISN